MNVDWLRDLCLSFPHATEHVQWGYDLVFKVGGKMFAITPLEPAPVWLTFKASEESFVDLTERPGIIPAPYLARAKWVALETRDALTADELAQRLRLSYDLVFAKLPLKTRAALAHSRARKHKASSSRKPSRRKSPRPKKKRTPR